MSASQADLVLEAETVRDRFAPEVLDPIRAYRDHGLSVDVERILLYVHDHLFDRRLERKIGPRLELDASAFEAFEEQIGESVEEMIDKSRIVIAARLAATLDVSQRVIAEVLGFENASQLARTFRQITFRPIGEYRRDAGIETIRPALSRDEIHSCRERYPALFELAPGPARDLIFELLEHYLRVPEEEA